MFCVLFSAPRSYNNKWMDHWQRITHTNVKVDGKAIAYNTLCNVRFQYFLCKVCISVCVCVVDFIRNVFNYSKAAKSLSVRACLRKYNKKHLFGNKSIGIKVHLHRNQSEIDFQIYIEYAFIVFYWMKIAFFGYLVKTTICSQVKSSSIYRNKQQHFSPLYQKTNFPGNLRNQI